MWNSTIEMLHEGRVQRVVVTQDAVQLRYSQVVYLWGHDFEFCVFFNRLLAEAPFPAFFWETPPVTRSSMDQPFECIVADSPALAGVTADASAFAEYFSSADEDGIVGFPNLGNDAFLIAPCPRGDLGAYPHLATFVREAPACQQQALWHRVGAAVAERVSDRPLWVSTSGLGVYWLHLRLDSYPKYYTYRPYTITARR
jgi:hypothetical protein